MSNTTIQNNSLENLDNSDWNLDSFLDDNSFDNFSDDESVDPATEDGLDLGGTHPTDGNSSQSAFGNQTSQITLDQIKALETRGQKLKNGSAQDPALLQLLANLETAERKERDALRDDTFHTSKKDEEAAQIRQKIAEDLYGPAFSYIEDQEKKFADSEGRALNPDYKEEDTAVSEVDPSKGLAAYKANPEVTLHSYFNSDGVNTTNIKDANSVTLFPSDPTDSFVVTFDADSQQFRIVTTSGKDNKAAEKTYFVDPTRLSNKIIIASSKVDTSKLSKEQRDKIQVGLDEAADLKAKRLDIINAMEWPSEGIAPHVDFNNFNESHWGGGGTLAEYIVKGSKIASSHSVDDMPESDGIDEAMKTGNWAGVIKTIQEKSDHDWNANWTQYNDEYANDAIRKIVTGIYRAAGATSDDDPRFMGLLKNIPVEVRWAMRDAVLHNRDEIGENHADLWNSERTAELLEISIKSETGESDHTSSSPTSSGGGDNSPPEGAGEG